MRVSLDEQIKCVKREIALRYAVYKRRVSRKSMSQDEMDREIESMTAVLSTLEALKQLAQ